MPKIFNACFTILRTPDTTNKATSKTCTRTLKTLGPEKPEPWKTWTQKNMDPKKPGPWKTWTLKNLDPEEHFYAKKCSCNNSTVKSKSWKYDQSLKQNLGF